MPLKKIRKRTKRYRGGKFIDQGAYGCVFGEPPLQCKGETSRRSSGQISKLMTKTAATDEAK